MRTVSPKSMATHTGTLSVSPLAASDSATQEDAQTSQAHLQSSFPQQGASNPGVFVFRGISASHTETGVPLRAVPDDFDNVQALHSPYGAVHGLGTPITSPVDFGASGYADRMMRPLMVDVRRSDGDDHLSPTGLSPAFGSRYIKPYRSTKPARYSEEEWWPIEKPKPSTESGSTVRERDTVQVFAHNSEPKNHEEERLQDAAVPPSFGYEQMDGNENEPAMDVTGDAKFM